MTNLSYELADDALRFGSDDAMAEGAAVPWSVIGQGCTAATAGLGGPGSPMLPDWVPAQIEWLMLSRTDGGEAFMRALPQGAERATLVAAVRERLAARWIGERLPVDEAQARLGMAAGAWGTAKVVALVLTVLAMLLALLVLVLFLLQPVIAIPASAALGVWLCRSGLAGVQGATRLAGQPTHKAASAVPGLVQLEGRAVAAEASPAGISGRMSAWWDVTVYLCHEDGDRDEEWQQVASRYGGRTDVLHLEDDTGRLPIWLANATLLHEVRSWDSTKESLPDPGKALLAELGFAWTGSRPVRVVEHRLDADMPLSVLGTLAERRSLPKPSEARWHERAQQLLLSGEWRRVVVGAVPRQARGAVAVLIAYVDMLVRLGHGGERAPRDAVAEPPDLAPADRVVWKGRGGQPFVVSNGSPTQALAAYRRRSLWKLAIGVGVLIFACIQFLEWM